MILTWQDWSKKIENQKLIKENMALAVRKYNNDRLLQEQAVAYMIMMVAPAGGSTGGSTSEETPEETLEVEILTEGGDTIMTEAGLYIITE